MTARFSIARRLSLLTGAVIALCLFVLIVAAYQMLTRSAITSTQARLVRSTRQLAAVAATGIRQNSLRYVIAARDPALERALDDIEEGRSGTAHDDIVRAARQGLGRLVLPSDSGMVVELWDASGRRVAYAGAGQSVTAAAPPNASSLGARHILREAVAASRATDSLRLSPLYVSGGRVYFWLVQPLIDRRGLRGFITHERQIASNSQTDSGASALAGEGLTTYYGNADGSVWSTVGGRPATPLPPSRETAHRGTSDDERVLVAAAPIRGTPLQVMMQSRRDDILAPSRSALKPLVIVGTFLIAAGMGAALLIGRRVAGPIVAIADAAEAIARGRYDIRVPTDGQGEMARLTESFNHMAKEVAAAEETRREVAHMGRVATVAELTASISHELRQPLTAIRSNAEAGLLILGRPRADLGDAFESFQNIVADCDRAEDVIDHVRLLLRKDSGATTPVDLNEICRQAVHLLQQDAARRRTGLDLALAPSSLTVDGDPVELQQVVLNLTLNALDAASTSTRRRQVRISTAASQDAAEIVVCDDGPGLPTHVQQRLFEPFFTTKTQGLGMGLAIVRSIVERHRGRVRAENIGAEGGAVFKVTLPVATIEARSGPLAGHAGVTR